MYKTGLYWFTNDLRTSDNPSLNQASSLCEKLICVYALDPRFRQSATPQSSIVPSIMGEKRYQFLYETLEELANTLAEKGQRLLVVYEPPVQTINTLCLKFDVEAVFRSQNAGYYENIDWSKLRRQNPRVDFNELVSHTLFAEEDLPFKLEDLPETFSKFRKLVEPVEFDALSTFENTFSRTRSLSPPVLMDVEFIARFEPFPTPNSDPLMFNGGESAAESQLKGYIKSKLPGKYKGVRNQLDGWENSTKISPWLALGSLSVNRAVREIQRYEKNVEANDSTYWIIFELLWREYFQWYAHRHKARLFAYRGIKQQPVLTSFYGNRFHAWCQGNTPYPIVNACMKQLNAIGYMSNRGRQIVASCFVNELGLDWRYGAAYFEQQLIDYDVASNWGNWQYLAGVGADPRGKRHFDLDKQTQTYDPDKRFREKWDSDAKDDLIQHATSLDSVDAADWPVE